MKLKSNLLKVTFFSLFLFTSIYANETKKENLFLGVDFSISNDVAKNGCNDKENKTLFGTLKAGYNLSSKPVRLYTSYSPIKWDYAKVNLFEVSADYIKPLNQKFDIFLGASLGYTKLKGDFSGKESKANYGFQTGFIYKLSNRVNLEIRYKYINTNDIKAIHNQNFLSLDNFNIFNLGVNYNF